MRRNRRMDGIERLSKMVEGQKDKYLKIIVEHLITKTELNQAFLNEEKNLKDMAKFIKDNARKQANNGVAVIEDAVVFKWAEDYFVKSNEELNFNKTDNKKIKENKKEDDEFGSIFGSSSNNEEKVIEQISIFG